MRSSKVVLGLLLASSAAMANGGKWEARKKQVEACLNGKGITSKQITALETCVKEVHAQKPDGRDAFKVAMDSCLNDSLRDDYTEQLRDAIKECRPKHNHRDG